MQLAGKMDGEIVTVMQEDQVQEKRMPPPNQKGIVWCNASSVAKGVSFEIDSVMKKERMKNDYNHIKLDATIKGVWFT